MYQRIATMVKRYLLLHLLSPARAIEPFFWPALELFLWGFMSLYIYKLERGSTANIIVILLTAIILWDILYRSQQSVSLGFMEELWTRNLINLVISPLRTWEWIMATYIYSFIKTMVIVVVMIIMAIVFYSYNLSAAGFYLIPLMLNLFIYGWALGLFTTGLLLTWGYAAEALIWAIPFLIQPFSAIFYPLSVYPDWLKPLCLALPVTHVMEGMRRVINTGHFPWQNMIWALMLNFVYLILAAVFFSFSFARARQSGKLVKLME